MSTPSSRLSGAKGFLPLSEETAISTRGQHLPQLIRERSTNNAPRRRRSSLDGNFAPATSYEDTAAVSDNEPPTPQQARFRATAADPNPDASRRLSSGAAALMTPQMRSMRLIGNSNPRYRWEKYFTSDEDLKKMKKPIRQYYERNNFLIQQYLYIDRLLDSSLPHDLIQEYQYNVHSSSGGATVPPTISEENGGASADASARPSPAITPIDGNGNGNGHTSANTSYRLKRTPKALYRVNDEETPLLAEDDSNSLFNTGIPAWEPDDEPDSQSRIVSVAIYLNLVANTVLLGLKIVVTILTSSVSVLASLVDAALDFLSTGIVWTTTRLISHNDMYAYPVGRRRLEPIGVLVFSVIMVTSFVQVAIEGLNHLTSDDHTIVQLTYLAIAIMSATVIIKFGCWMWCRLIPNSSVQALAQDAMTDVVFNIFSIIFPLLGYYFSIWWLDPLGGILLSFYVILGWSSTSLSHIRNLTGAAASADERNVLLYLTMRFAKTIKQIQGLQAYHSGDKLNVEVDIVLDEFMSLRDSHDLGESLQYVLESVPTVDRAFVHQDYASWNLPSHMTQQD
jgi:cation diffusion facilitator family transporter